MFSIGLKEAHPQHDYQSPTPPNLYFIPRTWMEPDLHTKSPPVSLSLSGLVSACTPLIKRGRSLRASLRGTDPQHSSPHCSLRSTFRRMRSGTMRTYDHSGDRGGGRSGGRWWRWWTLLGSPSATDDGDHTSPIFSPSPFFLFLSSRIYSHPTTTAVHHRAYCSFRSFWIHPLLHLN